MSEGKDPDLSQILAMPLTALVHAEGHAALTSLRFIQQAGFTGRMDDGSAVSRWEARDLGSLRMLKFHYQKQTAAGELLPMEMSIPLLALLPIPVLRVSESTFDFEVEIVSTRRAAPSAGNDIPALAPEVEVTARMPPSSPRSSSAGGGAFMRVQMHVTPSDLPGGIIQILGIMNTSVELIRQAPQHDDSAPTRSQVPPAS
jgi:hypothetical protein